MPTPSAPSIVPLHVHDRRLCAVCMTARHEQLRAAPRARYSAELVASTIRAAQGDVFAAVVRYGISYEHALRIRRGWRGAGRTADPIRFSSRGWVGDGSGHRVGWSSWHGRVELGDVQLRVLDGGRLGAEHRRHAS